MSSRKIDPEVVQQLVEGMMALFDRLGISSKEDSTLKPEFRCPEDSSSRTIKISVLLGSRPRGALTVNGNKAWFQGGNPMLDNLDPGPEPHSQKPIFNLGAGFAILGGLVILFASSPTGCYGWLMVFAGCIAMAFAKFHDVDLEERIATWAKKKDIADTHWRCEACGGTFLPESKPDSGSGLSAVEDGSERRLDDDTLNVEPLRRKD